MEMKNLTIDETEEVLAFIVHGHFAQALDQISCKATDLCLAVRIGRVIMHLNDLGQVGAAIQFLNFLDAQN